MCTNEPQIFQHQVAGAHDDDRRVQPYTDQRNAIDRHLREAAVLHYNRIYSSRHIEEGLTTHHCHVLCLERQVL
jgi:hypothetical protein